MNTLPSSARDFPGVLGDEIKPSEGGKPGRQHGVGFHRPGQEMAHITFYWVGLTHMGHSSLQGDLARKQSLAMCPGRKERKVSMSPQQSLPHNEV